VIVDHAPGLVQFTPINLINGMVGAMANILLAGIAPTKIVGRVSIPARVLNAVTASTAGRAPTPGQAVAWEPPLLRRPAKRRRAKPWVTPRMLKPLRSAQSGAIPIECLLRFVSSGLKRDVTPQDGNGNEADNAYG